MRALWFALLCACAAPKAGDTLVDSIRQYNDGVRWGRYGVAANHVPPKERAVFVEEADERANEIKIIDYEVVRVDAQSPREATVQIKMSWYRDSEGKLRETQSLQTWERHGKTWWMVDEARLKGHEMPGLAERAGPQARSLESAADPGSSDPEE
jgi:hypothetical protein